MRAHIFVVRDTVWIGAPLERVWRLSCSLRVVEQELKMRPVAAEFVTAAGLPMVARTTGLVSGGDYVRWVGWKFGLPQVHVSLISVFEPMSFFQDRMVEGRFARFEHDHAFRERDGGTVLADEIRFGMKWGLAGRLVGRMVLVPYLRGVLGRRFRQLKRLAESDGWREYLEGHGGGREERPAGSEMRGGAEVRCL